jgi:hypothetical protein
MSNFEKYQSVFTVALGVEAEQLKGLCYRGISEWDSVGHMALVAALEEAFDIMMDTDDIIALDSFEAGPEILKKYDVEF